MGKGPFSHVGHFAQGCSVIFDLAFACEIGSTDCAKEHIGQKNHISLAIFQPDRDLRVVADTAVLDGIEEINLGQGGSRGRGWPPFAGKEGWRRVSPEPRRSLGYDVPCSQHIRPGHPGGSRSVSLPSRCFPWPCPPSTGASNVQVQTETHLWRKGEDSKDFVLECDSIRLLHMYNELQKRYVRESKKNKEQSEAIKNLTIKIHELEHNLQEQRQRIEQLECKKVSWKTSAVSGKRSRTSEGGITSHRDISEEKESCCSKYLELLLKEIKKLKKENGKLSAEKRALKNELAGLDKEFFEEVEDLKHAVQECMKLNYEYEKCLKQISVMYGLPFTAHL
ncbi:centrosomal protein of 290 kDa-like [Corapipo altera]|uniref:centrosomal protein of 290 kDa-like n=1 Tax=Corapipo altera TaxID=415028 RepID=UPI000FD680AE|nr:centrosomal protein of 290 kDa-like [Corapipo altera]